MAMDMGKWKGLFEWSMKYQDGTRPTDYNEAEMTPEKREWLEQVMREYMKDLGDRMKEIKATLDSGSGASASGPQAPIPPPAAEAAPAAAGAATAAARPSSLEQEETLLDELMEIVESVDQARDLHKVGGLDTLLALMRCPQPSLRWRAAEVAATCMANNPPVQRWFLEGGAAPALMELLVDQDATCRTKALLALSALVRHFNDGLEAFRLAGGLEQLLDIIGANKQQQHPAAASGGAEQQAVGGDEEVRCGAAAAGERRLRRKALALLQYVLDKHPADCLASAEMGAVGALEGLLRDPASDSDLRHADLNVLLEIASHPGAWAAVKGHAPELPQLLTGLLSQHDALPAEDKEAEEDEGEAIRRLLELVTAPSPPQAKAGREDHVEVDDWQDGEQGSKTVTLNAGAVANNSTSQQQQAPLALEPPM